MVKWCWCFVLVAVLTGCQSRKQEPYPRVFHYDRTNIWNAAVDAKGQLWGTLNASPPILMKWEHHQWNQEFFLPGRTHFLMARRRGGLWVIAQDFEKPGKILFLVEENSPKAEQVLPLPSKDLKSDSYQLFEDRQGRLIFTDEGKIYVLKGLSEGSPRWDCLYTISDDQLWSYREDGKHHSRWNVLEVLEAVDGTLWFWTNSHKGGINYRCLRGLLKWGKESESIEALTDIPGLPSTAYRAACIRSNGDVLLSVYKNGVYQIPTDGLQAEPLEIPAESEEQGVYELFEEYDTLWMISGSFGDKTPQRVLWRQGQNRGWFKVVHGKNRFSSRELCPRILGEEGFWLGYLGGGLLWVRADGKGTRRYQWQEGQMIRSIRAIATPDEKTGAVVLWSRENLTSRFYPEEVLSLPEAQSPYLTWYLQNEHFVTQTEAGEIYVKFAHEENEPVKRWTGHDWQSLPLTKCKGPLAADSLERVWVIPPEIYGTTKIWNPRTSMWSEYPTYKQALIEESRKEPFRFTFKVYSPSSTKQAVFGNDGTIAYHSGSVRPREFSFYDGKEWSEVKARDLGGKYHFSDIAANDAGNICVLLHRADWMEYQGKGVWTPTKQPPQHQPEGFGYNPPNELRKRAYDLQGKNKSNSVMIHSGVVWLAANGNLVRLLQNKVSYWFDEEEIQPFMDGRQVLGVLKDQWDNTLVLTGAVSRQIVFLPKKEMPAVALVVKKSAMDAIEISAPQGATGWMRWKMDESGWCDWAEAGEYSFDALDPGTYVVETQYLDDQLNEQGVVQIRVELDYSIDKLIRAASKDLFSRDWDKRHHAVTVFARFHQRAAEKLSELRHKRAELNEADRWWLAATEQVVERSSQAD
jgi:hypothetical protein